MYGDERLNTRRDNQDAAYDRYRISKENTVNESQHRAATKQLEEKLLRQELAVEATKGMLDLLKSTQVDKQTGKK